MGVFDAEFLTILITTFVISHIDPVVKLLHCVRACVLFHRIASSRVDDLSSTK